MRQNRILKGLLVLFPMLVAVCVISIYGAAADQGQQNIIFAKGNGSPGVAYRRAVPRDAGSQSWSSHDRELFKYSSPRFDAGYGNLYGDTHVAHGRRSILSSQIPSSVRRSGYTTMGGSDVRTIRYGAGNRVSASSVGNGGLMAAGRYRSQMDQRIAANTADPMEPMVMRGRPNDEDFSDGPNLPLPASSSLLLIPLVSAYFIIRRKIRG